MKFGCWFCINLCLISYKGHSVRAIQFAYAGAVTYACSNDNLFQYTGDHREQRDRDEIAGVYLLSQLEHYTATLYVMENILKGVGVHPPPSPAWANFSIMMERTPKSGRCHSVCILCAGDRSIDQHTYTFGLARHVAWPGYMLAGCNTLGEQPNAIDTQLHGFLHIYL
jgi:hypothetical protein